MIPAQLPVLRRLAGWLSLLALPAAAASCNEPATAYTQDGRVLPLLSVADWASAGPPRPQAFMLADPQRVLVLVQPDLGRQGQTFARMVAFMEKSGLPRTRVPSQAELQQWLQRTGQRIETLTLGNNLDALRLARFYNLARWQGESLGPAEAGLLADLLCWQVLAVTDHGYLPGSGAAMLLTFPRPSDVPSCDACRVSEADSLAILGHEYQHARYFSDPALQHYTEWFWFNRVPLLRRLELMRLLERRGYDITQQSLLLDEFHAFLMQAEQRMPEGGQEVGMSGDVFGQLRQDFIDGMAAFEAGKGPTRMLPLTFQPTIQGEWK